MPLYELWCYAQGRRRGTRLRNKVTFEYLWLFLLLSIFTNSAIAGDNGLSPVKKSSLGGGTIQGVLIDKKTNNPVPNISLTIFTPEGSVQKWVKTDK